MKNIANGLSHKSNQGATFIQDVLISFHLEMVWISGVSLFADASAYKITGWDDEPFKCKPCVTLNGVWEATFCQINLMKCTFPPTFPVCYVSAVSTFKISLVRHFWSQGGSFCHKKAEVCSFLKWFPVIWLWFWLVYGRAWWPISESLLRHLGTVHSVEHHASRWTATNKTLIRDFHSN